ncbi:adenylosuccinate lyase [Candidatus Roizmanbacteria bacterium]|nr:adenylosuccinate lyase [Candidatus Roizmanbacteria bacterium]
MTVSQQTFELSPLTAINPLDGRYFDRLTELAPIVSEFGYIKARIEVETKFLVALSQAGVVRPFTKKETDYLLSFSKNINLDLAQEVKTVETELRHDVKSVEKVLRRILSETTLADVIEMIHFGLTSEDVNNLSVRLMLREGVQKAILPATNVILDHLVALIQQHKALPMLARTHGQAAVPTTLGKELTVFAHRMQREYTKLESFRLRGKLNGAVGNYNALRFAYPQVNWIEVSHRFIASLCFEANDFTTQISPYEDIIEYLQMIHRLNGIVRDFDEDIWRYISDDWFTQEAKKNEVGSSTMPQKVNPIDFENSEGNSELANALIDGITRELAVSRLQRDLTDSTVLRNLGTILGYTLLALKSTMIGLGRIRANERVIRERLDGDWSILTEGVQTILRRDGFEDPYTLVKSLSRGKKITKQEWEEWISTLPVTEKQRREIRSLTPETYLGYAVELCDEFLKK